MLNWGCSDGWTDPCLGLLLLVLLLFLSLCVVCAQLNLPLPHAAWGVATLADCLRRLASCRAGQGACVFVRGARAHICMAFECWPKLHMFHVLQMYVSSRCCICCNDYTRILQVYVSNISVVLNIYCKMLYTLQVYVSNICCKCFLSRCCICCNGYTSMLQVYVSNISAVLNVYCKCFI
jgi:hypothetical protein